MELSTPSAVVDELAVLHLKIQIALLESQAFPDRAEPIIDALAAEVRVLAKATAHHLAEAAERVEAAQTLTERAFEAGERRVQRLLEGIVATQIGKEFEPHGWYVYCLWGSDPDCPLYVGKSGNILARLGQHMSDPSKRYRIRRVTLIRCRSEREMDQTEAGLIWRYQPPLNTQGIRA